MELFGVNIPMALALVVGCVGLVYIYGKRRKSLLKDAGFPGPEPEIFMGTLRRFLAEGIDLDNKVGKEFGNVYAVWLGDIPMVNVLDPEILKEVLVKEFDNFTDRLDFDLNNFPLNLGIFNQKGASWRRLRNIISPTFSGSKLRRMCEGLNQCAEHLTRNLAEAAEKDEEIEIKRYFGAFTMDAIASTAFGIDCGSQSDFDNAFITETKKVFDTSFIENPIIFLILLFPGLTPVLKALGVGSFPRSTAAFFTKSLKEIVDARRNEPIEERKKRVDFLELMLAAEDKDDQPADNKNKKTMTTDEIIGQAFLFFLAGYETTASTLNFIAFVLATEPEVQKKLVDEIDAVIGDAGPDYDNIHKLPYMERVITETLRLYPVVPGLNREVSQTTTIKGWTFPKGVIINVPIPTLHRNPDVYPEPKKFKPERWETKSQADSMYYMPFGEGPRHCIGMRLAQVEIKIALVHVLKKFTFVPGPNTPAEFNNKDFKATGVFSPKVPIRLKVKMRN